MKSCSGTHHKLVPWWCPVWTGPWPEVPGSGAGEGQSGQFPPRASHYFIRMNHLTTRLASKVLTFIWGPGEDTGGKAIILR